MHNETPCLGREDGEALSSPSCHRPPSTKIIIRPVGLGSRGQVYSVLLEGAAIIAKTRNPTGDACRHLVALGRSGRLEVWDEVSSYPRLIISDMATAAAFTVSENERHGPRFATYKARPEFSKEAA
ncbi:MAG: hypothetical protein DI528_17970 [Shinella sp.]|nr:MAG: hypothetical protein DI528_17970 [Shinella sp.]